AETWQGQSPHPLGPPVGAGRVCPTHTPTSLCSGAGPPWGRAQRGRAGRLTDPSRAQPPASVRAVLVVDVWERPKGRLGLVSRRLRPWIGHALWLLHKRR